MVGTDFDYLRHVLVPCEIKGSDGDLVVIAEVISGEILDLFRPSSAPHQHLPIRTDLRYDLNHVENRTDVSFKLVKHLKE